MILQSKNTLLLGKKLFRFSLIFGIVMAVTVSLALQSLHAHFIQDRLSFGGWDDPFLLLFDFLKTMTTFILSAIWIWGIYRLPRENGKRLFLASLLHIVLASVCALLTVFWFDPFTLQNKNNLLLTLLNIGLNILLFLAGQGLTYLAIHGIWGITKEARTPLPSRLFSFRHPITGSCAINVLLFCLPNLFFTVKDTVDCFVEYGMPVNPNEWYTLLYPYAKLLIFMLVGYTVTVAVCHRIRRVQEKMI